MNAAETLLLPSDEELPDLPAETVTWLRDSWVPDLRRLFSSLHATRPTPNGSEEQQIVESVVRLLAQATTRVHPPSLAPWLHDVMARGFEGVGRGMLAAQDTTEKLALHHLEQALDKVLDVVVGLRDELATLSVAELTDLLNEGARPGAIAAAPPAQPETRRAHDPAHDFMRCVVVLLVALDVVSSENRHVEDVAFWANRSLTTAREIAGAASNALLGSLQGDLVRVRARHAWDRWTDADIAEELRPWPAA